MNNPTINFRSVLISLTRAVGDFSSSAAKKKALRVIKLVLKIRYIDKSLPHYAIDDVFVLGKKRLPQFLSRTICGNP